MITLGCVYHRHLLTVLSSYSLSFIDTLLEDFRQAQRHEETLKDLLSSNAMKLIENKNDPMKKYLKISDINRKLSTGDDDSIDV